MDRSAASFLTSTAGLLSDEQSSTLATFLERELASQLPVRNEETQLKKLEALLAARSACVSAAGESTSSVLLEIAEESTQLLTENLKLTENTLSPLLIKIIDFSLKLAPCDKTQQFAKEQINRIVSLLHDRFDEISSEEEVSLRMMLVELDCFLGLVQDGEDGLQVKMQDLTTELIFSQCSSVSSFAVSNLLPRVLASNSHSAEEIWDLLLSKEDFCKSNLTPVCLLMNIFMTDSSNSGLLQNPSFWALIQEGLVSPDQMLRKQARFMLKRALDFLNSLKLNIETENFSWSESCSLDVWNDFFLVIESLEEKQVHIIKPVLPLMERLFKEMDVAWALLALQQTLHHDSNHIVKWGFGFFFNLEPCPTKSNFFLRHVLPALNNTSLYYESDLSEKFEDYVKSIARARSDEKFFKLFLPAVSKISWGPVPLYVVCKALGDLPVFAVWDSVDLGHLKKLLVDAMATQDVFLRATCQSMLLRATLRLVQVGEVQVETWLELLSAFNRKESLARGLRDWCLLVEFIKLNPELHFKTSDFLESALISSKASGRYLLLLHDAGILSQEDRNALGDDIEWRLAEIQSRPYSFCSAPNQVDKLLELLAQIFIEGGVEGKKSLLAQILSPKALSGLWGYVRRRMEGPECIEIELQQTYIACLNLIFSLDGEFAKLFDVPQLLGCAVKITEADDNPLLAKYFAATMIRTLVDNFKSAMCLAVRPLLKERFLQIIKSKSFNEVRSTVNSTDSASQRNRLTSGILTETWRGFAELLDVQQGLETFDVPLESIMDLAEDAVERGGPETLPWILSSLKHFLHMEENSERVSAFLSKTFSQCFEHRKSDLFWLAIKEFVKMCFSGDMMARDDLQDALVWFSDELFEQSQIVAGLFNLVIENLCSVEFRTSRVLVHQVQLALIFGPISRKDQKILNDMCNQIIQMGPDIPANKLVESNCQASQSVRASALSFLLGSVLRCPITTEALMLELIAKDRDLSKNKKLRYFADSHVHRVKHRIAQSLLVIGHGLTDEPKVSHLLNWAVHSLTNESHQPSVRYLIEWLTSLILIKNENLRDDFFSQMQEATDRKMNSIPSFISILFLWIVGYANPSPNDPGFSSLVRSTIELILPWCMAQNYNIRLYGQVALLRIFSLCKKLCVDDIIGSLGILHQSVETSVEQSSGVKNAIRLQEDFFFSVFHPTKHLSLETIFIEFPRLTNVGPDEWLPLEKFLVQAPTSGLPIKNDDSGLSGYKVANWILKATGATIEVGQDTDSALYSIVQRKVTPWSAMFPENCSRDHRTPPLGGLVVVASLIDKAPNLGGLSRTCEIFGASELIIGNMKVVDDLSFQSLSVTAEKWINLSEVKPEDLVEYLNFMKKQGYTLMAAEQTSMSQPLQHVKFAKKTLVLLGNEKEGIPAELLPFLDVCVEVPQMGVIRSLNVHVTGALFIWQYFQQHLLKLSNQ